METTSPTKNVPALPAARRAEHMPDHLRHMEGKFKNRRGQSLSFCALFPEAGAPLRGVVLYLHGINEHCRRYYHLYEFLCAQGFGVVAYDLLSHGNSDSCSHNMRAHAEKFSFFVDDTNEFVTFTKSAVFAQMLPPGSPLPSLVLMGMSYGTLVSLHTALSEQHKFDAIVLVAPAVSVEMTTVLRIQNIFAKPLSSVLPKARIVPGVNRDWISRDPAFMADFDNDPLTVSEDMTTRMGEQTITAMSELQKDPRVEQPNSNFCAIPILFMMGSQDKVTSMKLARAFHDRIRNTDKEFKVFDGLYHAIFDEPERDEVLAHLTQWLQTRFPEPDHH